MEIAQKKLRDSEAINANVPQTPEEEGGKGK